MAKNNCTTLISLGRGISAEGVASPDTMRRAEVAADYYEAYRSVGLIVCSGAFSKSMLEQPPVGKTEAKAMADYLVRERGIPHRIVEVEDESQDTFFNFINTIEGGYLNGVDIDAENPLGIVAGIAHGIRARIIARQALGVPRRALQVVSVPGEQGLVGKAVELGGSTLTALALRGAGFGNVQDTRVAAERFEDTMGWARNLPMFSGAEAQPEAE